MEASENRGRPQEGCGGTDLHRIDPARVGELLHSDRRSAGYARLGVMVSTIIPRLTRSSGQRS